jgi:hypothetical protein
MADSLGYQQTVAVIGVAVIAIAGVGLYRSRNRRGLTEPLGDGHVTPEEQQAALTAGSPAPRPIFADTQQDANAPADPNAGPHNPASTKPIDDDDTK